MKTLETVEALILDCAPSGESYLKLFWLSATAVDYALLRESSRKTSARPAAPQLLEMMLETSRSGGVRFVREWRILTEWPDLARHYRNFVTWGNLVRFIRPNLAHLSDHSPVFNLMKTSLNALAAGHHAGATELKTLFQFGRDEGYPVREEWLATLGSSRREFAQGVLFSPLAGQNPDPNETSELVTSLKRYLAEVSHMHCEVDQDGRPL